jgi:hypothetical protein
LRTLDKEIVMPTKVHTAKKTDLGVWVGKDGIRYHVTEIEGREGRVYWETKKANSPGTSGVYLQLARRCGNSTRMRCQCAANFFDGITCKHLIHLKTILRKQGLSVWRG